MTLGRYAPLPVDPSSYTVQDGAGTVRSAVPRWRWTMDGLDEVPNAAMVALRALGDVLAAAGGAGDDLAALSAGVDARLTALAGEVGPTTRLTDAVDRHHPLVTAVESVDALLSAAARAVAVERVEPRRGTLARINVSDGGVPKSPVDRAAVGRAGLVEDRQATRRHHGRPSQAICLWSDEVIAALAGEGHPISPGAAGENLTVAGVDWSALRPGVRLAVGADVVAEVTGWADPCSQIAGCFAGHGFDRVDHELHPGWSRAYAAVVATGAIHAGDPVRVLP